MFSNVDDKFKRTEISGSFDLLRQIALKGKLVGIFSRLSLAFIYFDTRLRQNVLTYITST